MKTIQKNRVGESSGDTHSLTCTSERKSVLYTPVFFGQVFLVVVVSFLAWAQLVFASPEARAAAEAASFVETFNRVILFPTIALLSAVAFLVFLWGVAEYFFNAANEQARQQGVKHITFGIIGLVIMVSALAILSIAAATIGVDDNLRCAQDPSGLGCEDVFALPESVV